MNYGFPCTGQLKERFYTQARACKVLQKTHIAMDRFYEGVFFGGLTHHHENQIDEIVAKSESLFKKVKRDLDYEWKHGVSNENLKEHRRLMRHTKDKLLQICFWEMDTNNQKKYLHSMIGETLTFWSFSQYSPLAQKDCLVRGLMKFRKENPHSERFEGEEGR